MADWREVRVFISSTFRDMGAERDHLVKVVFPTLREWLLAYRMHLVDVDLRWGLTRSQVENDQVLDLCLAEIDRCRPFFIGLLGDRYGWVPSRRAVPHAHRRRLPGFAGRRSVTELEILHGVLGNTEMRGHALFYFRDPDCLALIPEPTRSTDYSDTTAQPRKALARLKRAIVESRYPVSHYQARWDAAAVDHSSGTTGRLASLERFGSLVGEQLRESISAYYSLPMHPPVAPPHTWATEGELHERFAEAKRRTYVPRPALEEQLRAWQRTGTSRAILVTGQPGCGKSALLAEHCRALAASGERVLMHFVGASPGSTDVGFAVRRWCRELAEALGEEYAEPADFPAAVELLHDLLRRLPASRQWTLVIDGADHFDDNELVRHLAWLPSPLPAAARVFVTCADDGHGADRLQALRSLGLPEMSVGLLSDAERKQVLARVPSLAAKCLDADQIAALLANPATRNPLFLLVALEELRGFGSYERLNEQIASLPRDGDCVQALFGQVLARLVDEFGRELVSTALCALASSRSGLPESELRALTAAQAHSASLAVVLRQIRPYLQHRGEKLDVFHAQLRTAIKVKWLPDEPAQTQWHLKLADSLRCRRLDPRGIEEVPWQLVAARDWTGLAALLAEPAFFDRAWQTDEYAVQRYWARAERESTAKMAVSYHPLVATPEEQEAPMLRRLGYLLARAGCRPEALALRSHLAARHREADDKAILADALGDLAMSHLDAGSPGEAMDALHEQERVCLELNDQPGLARTMGNQALVQQSAGRLDEALALLSRQLHICRALGNRAGECTNLGNQGTIRAARGEYELALRLYAEAGQASRELGDPAGVGRSLGNQALVHQARGSTSEALRLLRQQQRYAEELGDRAGLSVSLGNQAAVHYAWGDNDEAQRLLADRERLCTDLGDFRGLADTYCARALICRDQGRLDEALARYAEAERLALAVGSTIGRQRALSGLGLVHHLRGELSTAEDMHLEAERISAEIGDVAGRQACLGNRAMVRMARREWAAAESLLAEQESLCRGLPDPAGLASCLGNQALLAEVTGDVARALTLLRDEERICRQLSSLRHLRACLRNQARLHQLSGQPGQVLAALASLEQLLGSQGDHAGLLHCLADQAALHEQQGTPDAAQALLARHGEVAQCIGDQAAAAWSLGRRAELAYDGGDTDCALALLSAQEELLNALGDADGLARCRHNRSILRPAADRGQA